MCKVRRGEVSGVGYSSGPDAGILQRPQQTKVPSLLLVGLVFKV